MPLKLNEQNMPNLTETVDHQRLTSLINSIADAVLALDQEAKIVLYNAAALNIFDVNTIEPNTTLAKLFKPLDKNNQLVDIKDLVKGINTPYASRDFKLKYDDGSIINLYLSIAPVHMGYGETGQFGYVLLMRDITREKSLEEERDEFISVVSHELRTPITIAEGNIGNAEYVVNKSGDINSVKQALKDAHKQVLFLADMINDLSTLSRAERGKLQFEVEAINVHELVQRLAKSYSPQAEAKNLEIKVVIDPKLELLYSSRLYVEEILQNFVTNGLKYTNHGFIGIEAKADEKGVRFIVSDSGIGISKSDQERVFDKFFRSEDFRTRQLNGTGLGLYVTVKLAHLIHAEIDLHSELNKGSIFSVFVPNLS
jgi:two-component system phosphate regulon sensor histidine kinase PhoR